MADDIKTLCKTNKMLFCLNQILDKREIGFYFIVTAYKILACQSHTHTQGRVMTVVFLLSCYSPPPYTHCLLRKHE